MSKHDRQSVSTCYCISMVPTSSLLDTVPWLVSVLEKDFILSLEVRARVNLVHLMQLYFCTSVGLES
jgi:hypothetical protein